MFKTSLTAAAFTLIAGLAQASQPSIDLPRNTVAPALIAEGAQIEQVAYYCEWAYVYDAYGNWVAVWQCY